MKITIQCPYCLPFFEYVTEHVNDHLQLSATCSKGHKFTTTIQTEKFNLLFDAGCDALLNGYYSEAIFNVASAVERYHDYFVHIVLSRNSTTEENPTSYLSTFDKMWEKNLKNSSERQLGAFYIAYFIARKTSPLNFILSNSELRNKVIHRGHIPEENETFNYIKNACNYISEGVCFLKKNYQKECSNSIRTNMVKIAKTNPNPTLPNSTLFSPSIIDLISKEKSITFEQALSSFKAKQTKLKESSSFFLEQLEELKAATYKIHYDLDSGNIIRTYPNIFDYSVIPEPNITVDYESWKKFNDNQQAYKVDVTKKELICV